MTDISELDVLTSSNVALPSSPADRQKLKTMISEATYCLQRIDDERAAMKDIIDVIHTDYGVDKKHARKLIRTRYRSNYNDVIAEESDFEFLYEGLFAVNNGPEIDVDDDVEE